MARFTYTDTFGFGDEELDEMAYNYAKTGRLDESIYNVLLEHNYDEHTYYLIGLAYDQVTATVKELAKKWEE